MGFTFTFYAFMRCRVVALSRCRVVNLAFKNYCDPVNPVKQKRKNISVFTKFSPKKCFREKYSFPQKYSPQKLDNPCFSFQARR
jgi:hypothetical protein